MRWRLRPRHWRDGLEPIEDFYNVDFVNDVRNLAIKFVLKVPVGSDQETIERLAREVLASRLEPAAVLEDYRMVACQKREAA